MLRESKGKNIKINTKALPRMFTYVAKECHGWENFKTNR
jgi:hypothetical protein